MHSRFYFVTSYHLLRILELSSKHYLLQFSGLTSQIHNWHRLIKTDNWSKSHLCPDFKSHEDLAKILMTETHGICFWYYVTLDLKPWQCWKTSSSWEPMWMTLSHVTLSLSLRKEKRQTTSRVFCRLNLMEQCWGSQTRSRLTLGSTLLTTTSPAASFAPVMLRLSVTSPINRLYVSWAWKCFSVSWYLT